MKPGGSGRPEEPSGGRTLPREAKNPLRDLLPVGQKPFEPDIGQGVFDELLEDGRRDRDHMGAHQGGLDDMAGGAGNGGQDLGSGGAETRGAPPGGPSTTWRGCRILAAKTWVARLYVL